MITQNSAAKMETKRNECSRRSATRNTTGEIGEKGVPYRDRGGAPPTSSWGMLIFQTCPNHFSGVIVTLWFPQTYSAPELAASCQPHSFIQNTLIQKSLATSGSPGPPFKTPNRR